MIKKTNWYITQEAVLNPNQNTKNIAKIGRNIARPAVAARRDASLAEDAVGFNADGVITVAIDEVEARVVLRTGGRTEIEDWVTTDEVAVPETNVIEALVVGNELPALVMGPVPTWTGTGTNSTTPDSTMVVADAASLIFSVHTALTPAMPHCTSTVSDSSAVAITAPSETCVASSTSVTGSSMSIMDAKCKKARRTGIRDTERAKRAREHEGRSTGSRTFHLTL